MDDSDEYRVTIKPGGGYDCKIDEFVSNMLGMSHRDESDGWRRFGKVVMHDVETPQVFWYVHIHHYPNVHFSIETDYNVIELNPRIVVSNYEVVHRFYIICPYWYKDSMPNLYERCAQPRIKLYIDGRQVSYGREFLLGWAPN